MELILTIAAIHLVACLSPGPDIFLVVLNSLRHGRQTAILTTIGILCGVSLHITFGITGISYLLTRGEGVETAVGLAGGTWLLFLGQAGLRKRPPDTASEEEAEAAPSPPGVRSAWLQGFLVNLLNPKALLFFLSLFSVLLGPEIATKVKIAAGATMIAVQAMAFSLVAILVDRPLFRQRWARLQVFLDRGISIILVFLGFWIWWQVLAAGLS